MNKIRMYAIVIPAKTGIDEDTFVFFNGWDGWPNPQPKFGSPYMDGIRDATLYPSSEVAMRIINRISPIEIRNKCFIVDLLIQQV